ncbi:MAG: hypothetical protein ACRBHB_19205 [Arenicella sp.]
MKNTIIKSDCEQVMVSDKVANKRRTLRTLLTVSSVAGASAAALPGQWKKPFMNAIVLPAHAQTSVCPALVVGNSAFGPGSAPGTCGLSFELLSGDAAQDLVILSVSNSTPVGTDVVSYPSGTSGTASSTAGLAISWVGQAVGAPFACATAAPVPIDEVTFTVTYNCAGDAAVQTLTLSLQAIAASL